VTSPRTAQRLNQILSMLPWVIAHPGAAVAEVCERFGYTERQLAADLDLIFVCGLPGYGPGDLMVAYIDEDEVVVELADYFDRPMRLSTPEALALMAGALAVLSSGQAPEALERAAAKLQSAIIPDDPDALTVDLTEPDLVGVLRDAAAAGQVVAIDYVGLASGRRTEREVEPWSVFSTLGNWYVRAHCRLAEGERVFRVDRIRAATITAGRFEPPDHVPPPVVDFTPNEGDVRAIIRLGPRARWVADYYPVEMITDEDGALTVAFSAGDPAVAARLLLRLGGDAELLDGDEVRARLSSIRGRILTRYGGHSTDGLLAK
jgi:proteasome accessory factor C